MKALKFAAILALALGAAQSAQAATIDYIFSGTFTGSLGATNYTGQSFSVDLTGDTNNVTFGGGEYANVASAATFTIGSTTGNLLGNFNDVVLNPSFSSGTVIFGQAQTLPPFFVGEGLSNSGLATYNLAFAFASVTGPLSLTADSVYQTSLGDLTFNDISALSFEADSIAVSPVPLPAGFPLFAAALGLMGFMGWNRQRKTVRI